MIVLIAFSIGFYLGVLLMCLLAIGRKRKVSQETAYDVAAAA